jgi:phosphate transport system substrate-binding protein
LIQRSVLRSAIGSLILATVVVADPALASGVQLTVGGSTQMYTLGNLMSQKYASADSSVNIGVQPSSGLRGFEDTCQTALQFGMTDTYIQDNQLRETTCDDMINIPVAVSATPVVYNIPGTYFHQLDPHALYDPLTKKSGPDGFTLLHPVRLTAQVVADIYMGNVKKWNDPEIAKLNPGMSLPAQQIRAFNSSEPGSTAYVFNQWLCLSVPAWSKTVGISIAPAWPHASVGTPSTGAMVQNIISTPYSIGFAGFDFAISYKLQAAALKNASGYFLTPSLAGIARAIGHQIKDPGLGMPIDFRRSFVTVPGKDAFNPADFEFFVVHRNLLRYQPNVVVRQAVKNFLNWTVAAGGGQQYIESIELHRESKASALELAHGYIPVPDEILGDAQKLAASIVVQQ